MKKISTDYGTVTMGVPLKRHDPHDPKGAVGLTKDPLEMVPGYPLRASSRVLRLGAAKYGKWNWRDNKVCSSTYMSAMMRHLQEWNDGADQDEESKEHPLAHVIASAMIVLDAIQHQTLIDDRYHAKIHDRTEGLSDQLLQWNGGRGPAQKQASELREALSRTQWSPLNSPELPREEREFVGCNDTTLKTPQVQVLGSGEIEGDGRTRDHCSTCGRTDEAREH